MGASADPGEPPLTTVLEPPADQVDPAEVGFSAERLAAIPRFIDDNYLAPGRLPGFTLLVHRAGRTAHLSCQGHADVAAGVPLGPDTIVRIYSMSKPVASVALMTLFEEGRFQLDDPVSRFLPEWGDLRVWADGDPRRYTTVFPEREMQIRDLFLHTAGLTYGWMGRHPVDALYRRRGVSAPDADLAEFCDRLAELPLLFSPGTQWSYSVATDVLGRLVEVISGQPFDAFLQDRIFGPLGMVDTGFWVPDDRAHRLATNYAVPSLSPFGLPPGATGDDPVAIDGGDTSTFRSRPTFLSGGGGLVSTVTDYLRFCRMLLDGGVLDGARILGPRTVELMSANHLPTGGDLVSMGQPVFSETSYEGIGFGLGFSVLLDPVTAGVLGSAGEYAWGGAASTLFWIDPAEDLIVIGLTQLMPSSAYPLRRELRSLVYSALVD
jgi:CubicO group peptidase (beta-lactamase class C family)